MLIGTALAVAAAVATLVLILIALHTRLIVLGSDRTLACLILPVIVFLVFTLLGTEGARRTVGISFVTTLLILACPLLVRSALAVLLLLVGSALAVLRVGLLILAVIVRLFRLLSFGRLSALFVLFHNSLFVLPVWNNESYAKHRPCITGIKYYYLRATAGEEGKTAAWTKTAPVLGDRFKAWQLQG